VVVWTLGEIGFNAVGPALIADIAPPALRGRYSAAVGVAFGAAAFVAPLAGTRVFQSLGEVTLWAGCLVVCAASAAIIVALAPAVHARRTAVAAQALADIPA
jgi:MFS family permease